MYQASCSNQTGRYALGWMLHNMKRGTNTSLATTKMGSRTLFFPGCGTGDEEHKQGCQLRAVWDPPNLRSKVNTRPTNIMGNMKRQVTWSPKLEVAPWLCVRKKSVTEIMPNSIINSYDAGVGCKIYLLHTWNKPSQCGPCHGQIFPRESCARRSQSQIHEARCLFGCTIVAMTTRGGTAENVPSESYYRLLRIWEPLGGRGAGERGRLEAKASDESHTRDGLWWIRAKLLQNRFYVLELV